jgi:hypothetical protein
LEAYRKKEQKKRVGAKYPVHVSRLKLLFQWFPDAKIIFLIRDARAIITSKLNDEKTRERKSKKKILTPFIHYITLLFFIVDYIWAVLIFKKYKKHPNLCKIRYEDLVSAPERYVPQICAFCEIPFENSMSQAFGKPSSFSGKIAAGFDVNRIVQWKKNLSRFDFWLVTFLTFPGRFAFGYHKDKF